MVQAPFGAGSACRASPRSEPDRPPRDEWRPWLCSFRCCCCRTSRRRSSPAAVAPSPITWLTLRRRVAALASESGWPGRRSSPLAAILIAHVAWIARAATASSSRARPGHESRSDRTREGMSPARARTSTERSSRRASAARVCGLEAVTMQAVAAESVQAPSLYKRFPAVRPHRGHRCSRPRGPGPAIAPPSGTRTRLPASRRGGRVSNVRACQSSRIRAPS